MGQIYKKAAIYILLLFKLLSIYNDYYILSTNSGTKLISFESIDLVINF